MSSPRRPIPLLLAAFALPVLTGGCGAPLAVTAASYGSDAASLAVSSKSTSDHLVSVVLKQDCAMWRVLRGRKICREREGGRDPYDTRYGEPYRQPSEDGVAYGAPLRPPPDAPATSWDAATYAPAPAPEPAPAPAPKPVTAVAEATPLPDLTPAPEMAPETAPEASFVAAPPPTKAKKAKKPKKTVVAKKKPSPDRVVASR